MNDTVKATGMEVKAVASGSLLIGDTTTPSQQTFTYAGAQESLTPMTYAKKTEDAVDAYIAPDLTTSTIAPNGAMTSATWLESVTAGTHYIDYVFYIAALEDYAATSLTATVTFTGVDTSNKWTHQALTVDYAIGYAATDDGNGVETKTFEDLTRVAGVTVEDASYATTLTFSGFDNIGAVGTADTICVVARVYFDGAETTDAGVYYVQNNNVNTGAVGISIDFKAA